MIDNALVLLGKEMAAFSALGAVLSAAFGAAFMVDGALLSGAGTLLVGLVSVATFIVAQRANRKIAEVKKITDSTHDQVTTINSRSIAQLADDAETRRIEKKQLVVISRIAAGETILPEEIITPAELSHMRTVDEARDRVARPEVHAQEGA